jgi:Predicted Co/Zn/Cd cation transporters
MKRVKKEGERTLLASVIMSSPGAVVTGVAALFSTSGTQFADFLRRTAELIALLVSYFVFRKIQRKRGITENEKQRYERTANICVGISMILAGVIMLSLSVTRINSYTLSGNVAGGLIIAVLGVVMNCFLCMRYRSLSRNSDSEIISAQFRLYRAKTAVDLCVSAALLMVALMPDSPVTKYVDIVGTALVALYILYNGAALIIKQRKTKQL